MIPKKIHYCWFGRGPKPKLAKKCIKSWKRYCRGYEFIEWNEDNFDIESAPLYVRQAYEAKKWAFVTDYVRLWAMTKYGGFYMDTDVEVIRPLDRFLGHEGLSGYESKTYVQTGLMACREGFPLFEEFLKYYDDAIFINQDGSFNQTTNVQIMTGICQEHGLVPDGTYKEIEGFAIYPQEYFCPLVLESRKLNKTKNTYTIHWFSGSWVPEETKRQIRENYKKSYKRERINRFKRMIINALGKERYARIKRILKKDRG